MKNSYRWGVVLCASTTLIIMWYFFGYQWIDAYITRDEQILKMCIKNCSQAHVLERKCKGEKECILSLTTECEQCIDTMNKSSNDESIINSITDLLETHKLTLIQYKRMTKEKKEWHSCYRTTIGFQGSIPHVLAFFDALAHNKQGIVTTNIELSTDNKQISHVTAHLAWIICKP